MITIRFLIITLLAILSARNPASAQTQPEPHVAIIDMDMMILPGTSSFLKKSIEESAQAGAKMLIVRLNTPGGLLQSSQEMIQTLFKSPIPVVIYVTPSGSTATSAGVFITLAGHVAAMAPGTSIGAAHPVQGDGKDIEGDMRAKAENMTVAMVKSISEQRGRNVAWAEKAVKESSSLTEKEALNSSVVDIVADDIDDLLKRIKGKEVKLDQTNVVLEDYSKLPRRYLQMTFQDRGMNILANPTVAAMLLLAATTGLSIELYNPGAILPGVVGVICLILSLVVSQVIPMNQGAVLLLIVGALLIGAELYVPSGILAVGGIVAIVLGTIYLVDVSQAPGLAVSMQTVLPVAVACGGILYFISLSTVKALKKRVTTGFEGLLGKQGKALETFSGEGRVFINGEIWKAHCAEGIIEKDDKVEIIEVPRGLVVEVKKV